MNLFFKDNEVIEILFFVSLINIILFEKSCNGYRVLHIELLFINNTYELQVHDRLNAVGLDISILVQPIDLVKAMKKQLKALRSYKDYIVQ